MYRYIYFPLVFPVRQHALLHTNPLQPLPKVPQALRCGLVHVFFVMSGAARCSGWFSAAFGQGSPAVRGTVFAPHSFLTLLGGKNGELL